MASVGARRHTAPDEVTIARQRFDRLRSRKDRRARGSALARHHREDSWSRRGDRQRAATMLGVVASVGPRQCGQHGARGARRRDRRAPDEVGSARSRNDVLAAWRALAVVVSVRIASAFVGGG